MNWADEDGYDDWDFVEEEDVEIDDTGSVIWEDKEGDLHRLDEMETTYLKNVLGFLLRTPHGNQHLLKEIRLELRLRTLEGRLK